MKKKTTILSLVEISISYSTPTRKEEAIFHTTLAEHGWKPSFRTTI